MHNFLQNRSKYNQSFLFLFFYSVTLSGMEVAPTKKRESGKRENIVTSNRRAHTPDQLIQIFSPKQAFKTGTPWNKIVPKSIMITPDSKGVILVEYGAVRQCFFDAKEEDGSKIIIEHYHAKKSFPLVTMAQKKDESLVIISAANYTKGKRAAEYVVFCNNSARREKLNSSVQAISSDSCGKMLAIAGSHSIKVVDLETYKSAEATFSFFHNDDNWIVDVAMNPEGKWLVAAGNQKGQIQWFSIVKENSCITLNSLKQIIVDDIIKNIYYPNRDELLYVACNKRVKSIVMNDMLTSNNEHVKTADTIDFDTLLEGEKFAVDQAMRTKVCCVKNNQYNKQNLEGEKIAVDQAGLTKVCCVQHNKQHEDITSTIEVWRKNNNENIEIIPCEIPLLQEHYNYITDAGLSASGVGHLLHVAVGRNHVVALATDGTLRVWDAPGKHVEVKKVQETEEKIESDFLVQAKGKKHKRDRAGSGKDNRHNLMSSDEGDGEKKKSSPRKQNLVSSDESEVEKKKPSPRDLIQKFKNSANSSTNSSSKDLSPPRSHKNSDSSLKVNEEK